MKHTTAAWLVVLTCASMGCTERCGLDVNLDQLDEPMATEDMGSETTGQNNTTNNTSGNNNTTNTTTDPDMGVVIPTGFKIAQTSTLIWKKRDAFTNDLARALGTDASLLCKELDASDCSSVHLSSLGGNDPFALGTYVPVAEPLATTPAVIDRMVLGTCANVVEAERAGTPNVFAQIPLDRQLTGGDADAADAQVTELTRRFFLRDPLDEELEKMRELMVDGTGAYVSGSDFAKLACYVLGSSSEFVFY